MLPVKRRLKCNTDSYESFANIGNVLIKIKIKLSVFPENNFKIDFWASIHLSNLEPAIWSGINFGDTLSVGEFVQSTVDVWSL